MTIELVPYPHMQPVHCPACGHGIGEAGFLDVVKLGWGKVFGWLVLKGVRIGTNGALVSEKFAGSVCDRCPLNRRKLRRGE